MTAPLFYIVFAVITAIIFTFSVKARDMAALVMSGLMTTILYLVSD